MKRCLYASDAISDLYKCYWGLACFSFLDSDGNRRTFHVCKCTCQGKALAASGAQWTTKRETEFADLNGSLWRSHVLGCRVPQGDDFRPLKWPSPLSS